MKKTYLIIIWLICLFTVIQNSAESSVKNIPSTSPSNNPSIINRYEQYISEGLKFFDQNQYSEAAIWFKKAQGFLPNIPEAYLNLGIINIYQGNIDKAERLLKRAEQLSSASQSNKDILLYNLGVCAHIKGNYQQAVEYFSLALEVKPLCADAKYGLEMSSRNIKEKNNNNQNNNFNEQPITRTKNLAKIPTDKDSSQMADNFLKEGSQEFNKDNDKAILLIKKSISLKPNNPEAYYRLGVIYDRQKQLLKAEECFKNVLKLTPQMAKAYLNLGNVYGKLKKYKLALKTLTKAAKLNNQNPKVPYNISMVYIATGKKNQALAYLEKAMILCQKSNNTSLLEKIKTAYQKIKGK